MSSSIHGINFDNQTVTALKAILTDLGLPISALN